MHNIYNMHNILLYLISFYLLLLQDAMNTNITQVQRDGRQAQRGVRCIMVFLQKTCIPASVIVLILNSSSSLQNQILSILSWNTPSKMPGGRINTMSWRILLACSDAQNRHNMHNTHNMHNMSICKTCIYMCNMYNIHYPLLRNH